MVNGTETFESGKNPLFGGVATVLCVLFYGSAYTPIRVYEGGDGVFIQWLMCCGQMLPAFILSLLSGFPPIYPLAMVGGVLYSIANCFTIPIMARLGLTLAPLLWNSTNCLVGWAVGRFGLFGVTKSVASMQWLNMAGVAVVIAGGGLCTTVKTKTSPLMRSESTHGKVFDSEDIASRSLALLKPAQKSTEVTPIERAIAIVTALFLGAIYGNLLTPIGILIKHNEQWKIPASVEPYLFSHFLGAYLSSTLIFVVYCVVRRNSPYINPAVCLPALLAGALMGAGEVLFFIANHHLSQVIAFPIITMTPPFINSLYGIFLFKEIQGTSNLLRLLIAYSTSCVGVTLITLSKFEL